MHDALIAGTPDVNAFDAWCIAVVRALRHRVETRHSCRCEECRAIKRVCALANEAVAMKAARVARRRRK